MERKIIKQGGGGYTIYLPKKWSDKQNINAGETIHIEEDGSKLVLTTKNYVPPKKETVITIEKENPHIYRGILGGLYRAGYQTIKVHFKDIKIIPILEKAVSSLYGFEIFDIEKNTCTINGLGYESTEEIKKYVQKMIHTVNTMQTIITENIEQQKHENKEEIFQYRSNILKYRDLIVRTIISKKLFEDKQFPYYQISISLWNVARNYNQLYQAINLKNKPSKASLAVLKETNEYVTKTFSKILKKNIYERFEEYNKLRNKITDKLQDKKELGLIFAFCLNITISAHSADSSIAVLNFANK